jgi:hypothetical protein
MPIHDIDLARIHIADLLAEAENERLVRQVRQARERRTFAARPIVRLAVTAMVAIVLAIRALPGTV